MDENPLKPENDTHSDEGSASGPGRLEPPNSPETPPSTSEVSGWESASGTPLPAQIPAQVIAAYEMPGATAGNQFDSHAPMRAEVARPAGPYPAQIYRPRRRKILLPLILFVATCFTTYGANGPLYAAAVMFILTSHELGHFFQTLRYKIHASLPMFIPMPFPPLGTMGAVIGMAPHEGDRKALFDVAVSGPLAGLVPTLICCVWGLQLSEVVPLQGSPLSLGEPLLFKWMSYLTFGPIPEGYDVMLHPIAFAGWVGLLITALNLFPIGQLDGGHTLYALLGKKAHVVARAIWIGCLVYMVMSRNWGWSLMLALVWLMGTAHPPTADDTVPLGTGRKILGWALLLFLPIGFTPTPFLFPEMENGQRQQPRDEVKIVRADSAQRITTDGQSRAWLSVTDHNLSDHHAHQQQRHTADQNQELQGHLFTHQKKNHEWKRGRHSLPANQLNRATLE